MQNIRCKHLIAVIFISFVFIFSGAFVIKTNSSSVNANTLFLDGYDRNIEDSLSFLDDFVVEDVLDSPLFDSDSPPEERRISKRSLSNPSVPQYMLDIYERLLDKRLHIKFDTARSFHSSSNLNNIKSYSNELNVASDKEYKLHHLLFNVSHFPQSEKALFAHLRIQIMPKASLKILDSKAIETYSISEDSPVLLYSKMVNPSKEFLFTVDVTNVFEKALQSEAKQLLLAISLPDVFLDLFVLDDGTPEGPQLLVLSKTVEAISEDKILTRMRRSLEGRAPELSLSQESDGGRWKRSNSEDEDEEAEEQSNYIVEELGRIRKGKLKRKKNPCRRKPMHVNFAAINYDQWIIAPPSYEAFECTGKCSFPMSAHLAPTKHAIIQTLMHSLEPKQVSRACCVPIKLAPISILYVDDDGTVTYKYDYEDMVVAECGCR
ncbi:bone morphogenetic protein 10-like [Argiope bruennichi]|uniref:bone morphogenetic protein 10-like n=1 Tax=Argiope bruennichi TaxID=94029 RepID=UPI00249588E0|nr:bone morphogenetic protein 10-like [Argiope bruennichi]